MIPRWALLLPVITGTSQRYSTTPIPTLSVLPKLNPTATTTQLPVLRPPVQTSFPLLPLVPSSLPATNSIPPNLPMVAQALPMVKMKEDKTCSPRSTVD
ncbi:hypothetical protein B0T13DRAFT_198114 [Neurospora crassa]|nr:hypothetical protein B0T13DRAFT_198114 [Neurospora crassa]